MAGDLAGSLDQDDRKRRGEPAKYYIGPRVEEVRVTYVERGSDGKAIRKKRWLHELLAKVAGEASDVRLIEVRHADPRTLILSAVDRLSALVELYAKIRGEIQEPGLAILVSPDWLALQRLILDALAPFPDAAQAVAAALDCSRGAAR